MAIYSSSYGANQNGRSTNLSSTPTPREQKELDALLSDIYAGIEKLPDRSNLRQSATLSRSAPTNGYNTTPSSYGHTNQYNTNGRYNGVSNGHSNGYRSMPKPALSPALRSVNSPTSTATPTTTGPQSLASFMKATTPESKRRVRIIDNKGRESSESSPSPPPVAVAHRIDDPIRYSSNGDLSPRGSANGKHNDENQQNRFIYHQDEDQDDNEDDDDDDETHVEVEYHERSWLDNKLGRLGRKRRGSKEMTDRQLKEKAMIEELKRNLKNGAITLRQSFKGLKSKKEAEDEVEQVRSNFRGQEHQPRQSNGRSASQDRSDSRAMSNGNSTLGPSPKFGGQNSMIGQNKFATIAGRGSTRSQGNNSPALTKANRDSECKTINLSAATPPLVGPSPTPYTTSTLPRSPVGNHKFVRQSSDVIGYGKANLCNNNSHVIPPVTSTSTSINNSNRPSQQAPVYANPHASLMQHKLEQQANIKNVNQRSLQEFNELNSLLNSLAPTPSYGNRQYSSSGDTGARQYVSPPTPSARVTSSAAAATTTTTTMGSLNVQQQQNRPTLYGYQRLAQPAQHHTPAYGQTTYDSRQPTTTLTSTGNRPGGTLYAQVNKGSPPSGSSDAQQIYNRTVGDHPHRYGGTNMTSAVDKGSTAALGYSSGPNQYVQQQKAQPIYGQYQDPYIANVTETPMTDEGFVLPSLENYQAMSKFTPVNNSYWYKPAISREAAINLLRDKPQGTFIVRDSTSFKGAFGLAVKVSKLPRNVLANVNRSTDLSSELIRHFLIEPTNKGVRLKGYPNEPIFSSLPALVYQHSITEIALPCKLVIPRTDIEDPKFNEKQRKFYQELDRLRDESKLYANQTHIGSKVVKEKYGDLYANNEHRMVFE